MDATQALNNLDTIANASPEQPGELIRKSPNQSRRNRPPRHEDNNNPVDRSANPTQAYPGNRRPGKLPKDGPNSVAASTLGSASGTESLPRTRNTRRRNPQKSSNNGATLTEDTGLSSTNLATVSGSGAVSRSQHPRSSRRGAKFNASLTGPSVIVPAAPSGSSKEYRARVPQNDDLTSTMIYAISTPPYPDCLICFSAIHPAQATWSCSPAIPLSAVYDQDRRVEHPRDAGSAQCCWTTFHLKCIRSWAEKSVKEVSEAWRARGEDRTGEWRCPGCRSERDIVPNDYWCFCGSTPEPKLTRLATPHSCGNLCTRPRTCGHACALACHPGPCPPCQIMTIMPCHCGRRNLSFKCSRLGPIKDGSVSSGGADLSCGAVCEKKLLCGSHSCHRMCHAGDCEPCLVRETVRCYCGRADREVRCGEGEAKECALRGYDGQGQKWVGRFSCESDCNRPLDCGVHVCSKSCHPPSFTPPPCRRSPSLTTHCPCGKHELSPSNTSSFPPSTILPRTKCTDPIPVCNSTCMRPLADCSHVCSNKCHDGPCPPCTILLVRPCRCGATTKDVKCSTIHQNTENEILCDRLCSALRACGRHQCNRVCCPLASLGAAKGKGKKRAVVNQAGMDVTGLHECDLICAKMLVCGNHRCEERDHRGVCPPCLRSGFEEMICYCGRTVLEPPIRCGTYIQCVHLCTRPPPPCGHPRTQHSCHEDPSTCPPCPFLTSKNCACGKKAVDNVRCSQEKVSCGAICRRLLGCGFHHCEKLCHSDDCGSCNSPCGKFRKLCLPEHHPCTLPCHAPSSCTELEPCRAVTALTCPCRRIRQAVPCARSVAHPSGCESTQQPKCNNDCSIAKRNAKLADALGINIENREKAGTVFSDELILFARTNSKLLALVEKSFAEFVSSDKRTHVLPPMPVDRRKFVLSLGSMYRMDTQMVDQEPHRSVQLLRRIDTRIPVPLLSEALSSSSTGSLGKLADLRTTSTQLIRSRSPVPPNTKPAAATGNSQRGWTSVVTRSGASTPVSWANSSTNPGQGVAPTTNIDIVRPSAPMSTPMPDPQIQVPDDWEDDT